MTVKAAFHYSSEAKAKAVMAMIGTLAEYLRIVLLE